MAYNISGKIESRDRMKSCFPVKYLSKGDVIDAVGAELGPGDEDQLPDGEC